MALKPMLADPNFALTFQANKVVASKGGDLVYAVGSYNMTVSDEKTKKPVTDKGKYLTVYKKQADGSWKAVANMISSDMPLAGVARNIKKVGAKTTTRGRSK
jgi:ketosteroid isomerase-like protein